MSAFATFRLGWGSAAQGPGGPGKGAAPAVNTGLNSLTWGRPGVVRGKEALLRCWGAELGMPAFSPPHPLQPRPQVSQLSAFPLGKR